MAKQQLAQMLDELMGRNRNLLPDEKPQEIHWSDSQVCKFALCGFCPHDLFVNTKADLGPCDKLHDDEFKKAYQESSRFEKVGYEQEFLRFLQQCINDKEKRIKRAQARLEMQNEMANKTVSKNDEKTKMLTDKINDLLAQVEELGNQGEVEEAQGMMKLVDQLRSERDALSGGPGDSYTQEKQMEVCRSRHTRSRSRERSGRDRKRSEEDKSSKGLDNGRSSREPDHKKPKSEPREAEQPPAQANHDAAPNPGGDQPPQP